MSPLPPPQSILRLLFYCFTTCEEQLQRDALFLLIPVKVHSPDMAGWCPISSIQSNASQLFVLPCLHTWSRSPGLITHTIYFILPDCYFSIAGYEMYSAITLLLTINLALNVVIGEYSWLKSLVLFSSVFFVFDVPFYYFVDMIWKHSQSHVHHWQVLVPSLQVIK
jgi:hypothetical protein